MGGSVDMGKREHLPVQKNHIFIGLSLVFLLGALVGCIFAALLEGQGIQELRQYLSDYLELMKKNEIEIALGTVFWGQSRYFLFVALFSVSVIGIVAIPMLMGVRGFLFAFSFGVCYRIFGMSGLCLALTLFGIPALFWYPGFLLFGMQGICGSMAMTRQGKGESSLSAFLGALFTKGIAGGLAFLLIAVMLEYGIVPVVLEWVLQMI